MIQADNVLDIPHVSGLLLCVYVTNAESYVSLSTPVKKFQLGNLSTFSQPHQKEGPAVGFGLDRSWGSVGDLLDRKADSEKVYVSKSTHKYC